jgi:hypothetical protein
VAGKVEEIVSLVTDKDDWLINADKRLMYSTKEKWDIIPADKRSDRQTLIAAVAAYFDVFSNKTPRRPIRIYSGWKTERSGTSTRSRYV